MHIPLLCLQRLLHRNKRTYQQILILLVIAISWLSLGYQDYTHTNSPPEFRVESLSVSSFNLAGSQITAKWNAGFVPSKKDSPFLDQHLNFSVFYQNQLLSQQVVAPLLFDVPVPRSDDCDCDQTREAYSYSVLKVKSVALDETIDGWMAQVMAMGRAQGVLAFNLKLEGVGGGKTTFRVFCENIKVRFSHRHSTTATILLPPTPDDKPLCTDAPNYMV